MVVDGIGDMDMIIIKEHKTFEDFFKTLLSAGEGERPLIWRGQADANWKLEASLSRLKNKNGGPHTNAELQFNRFQQASRGRMSGHVIEEEDADEWLALGHHYGLATPLLDWTSAPFIATFFAFVTAEKSENVAVYSLDPINLITLRESLKIPDEEKLHMFFSKSSTNPRLIAQQGLFTNCPFPYIIEDWLIEKVIRFDKNILTKHIIPSSYRESALRSLTRMNINYLTLFPDLEGAAKHSNLELFIDSYW